MGGRVGRSKSKFYKETRGIKVSGGQIVPSGKLLTREGDRWRAGINVTGKSSLSALCAGEIYFTRKKSRFNKVITLVNIRPVKETVEKK